MNEFSYRRPSSTELDESEIVWIEMGDGGSWAFPRVFIRIRPTFTDGKVTGRRLISSINGEFDGLVEENKSIAAGGEGDFLLSCMKIAEYMLNVHYDIPDEVMEHILEVPSDNEDAPDWVNAVMTAAHGRSPKKESPAMTSGGDAASPSMSPTT